MSEWKVFFNQARALTLANLRTRYRNTFAGFIWTVLNPAIMFGAQGFVFSRVLQMKMEKYPVFLISGLLPWIFISQSLEKCTSLLVESSRLLKSYPVHPAVYIAAQVMDQAINLFAAFFLISFPMLVYFSADPRQMMLVVFPLFTLAVGVFAMAWLLSISHVFFRDTKFIVTFILSVAFFLTPVFYPLKHVPSQYHWIIFINPFFHLIKPFQILVYQFSIWPFIFSTLNAFAMSVAIMVIALFTWKHKRNVIYFHL